MSLLISLVLVLALYPLLESTLWFPNRMYAIIGVMLALSLAFVGYMELLTQPPVGSSEALLEAYENWAEARNNAYTMAGAVAGVLVVYAFDTKLLQFPTRAPLVGTAHQAGGGPGPGAGGAGSCCGSPCWPSAAATPWPGACATS